MRFTRHLIRAISISLAVVMLVDTTDMFGLRRPHGVFAAPAQQRPTDVTELGISPMLSHPWGAIGRPGNLPLGFDALSTFHEGLVQKAEGYFRIAYQDIAIPGSGPALEVHRIYNSHVTRRTAFGRGWSWSWGVRLTKDEDTGDPVFVDANNLRVHFHQSGNDFLAINSARQERLTYGGGGAVITLADNSKQYFTGGGQLAAIEDARGRRLELHYAGTLLMEAVDSVGRRLSFTYEGTHINSITDPIGRVWRYEYSGANLAAAVDPLGRRTEYHYLPKFGWGERMSHVRFANNIEMTIYYHPLSKRVIRITGPGPMGTHFKYLVNPYERSMRQWTSGPGSGTSEDRFEGSGLEVRSAQDKPKAGESGDGEKVLYLSKSSFSSVHYMDNLSTHRDREGGTTLTAADSGRVQVIDPLDHTATIEKDSEGRPTRFTDAADNQVAMQWDQASGQVSQMTMANGGSISMRFDKGELRSVTDPLGHTTSIEPTSGSTGVQGYKIIDALSHESMFELDTYGYPKRVRNAAGAEMHLKHDAVGRLLEKTDATGGTWRFAYDAADNLIESKDPTGAVTLRTYDAMNHLTRLVDPMKRQVHYTYDQRGLMTEVVLPGDVSVKFEYNAAGGLIAIHRAKEGGEVVSHLSYDRNQLLTETQDPLRLKHSAGYDRAGRCVSLTSPGGGQTALTPDEIGRVTDETLPDGTSVHTTYGPTPQVQSVVYQGPGGSTELTYDYDLLNRPTVLHGPAGVLHAVTYDELGRTKTIESPGCTCAYEYDQVGRPVTVRSGLKSHPSETHYEYDAAGRVKAMVEPTGDHRAYAYDAAGRLSAMQIDGLGAVDISRNAGGEPTSLKWPNGGHIDYSYDTSGRLASMGYVDPGGAAIASFAYTYDALGNVQSVSEAGRKTEYRYDDNARLLSVTSGRGGGESYAYDVEGNLTNIGALNPGEIKYDPANKLVQTGNVQWGYDQRGNLVSKSGGIAYRYDDLGRLVRIDFADHTYAAYAYDAVGRRVQKDINGTITRYAYNGAHLIAEFDGNDQPHARYVYAPGIDRPLAMSRDGKWYYFVRDRIGSIRALLDETGRQIEAYDYTAYGAPLGQAQANGRHTISALHPFGFAGREYDAESGLYYMRARYYDPAVGRFIQRDLMGIAAGSNLYAYVDGNPVGRRDPLGLEGDESSGEGEQAGTEEHHDKGKHEGAEEGEHEGEEGQWGTKWNWIEWGAHGLGGVAAKVSEHVLEHPREVLAEVRASSRVFTYVSEGGMFFRPANWAQQAGERLAAQSNLWKTEQAFGLSAGWKTAFEAVAYLAFAYQVYEFIEEPTQGNALNLCTTAGIMLLFFGLEFGLAPFLIAAGVGIVLGLAIYALLEYFGILHADPSYVQPTEGEVPLGALRASPAFLGPHGLMGQWDRSLPVRLYDGDGHFLLSLRSGIDPTPDDLQRAGPARYALAEGPAPNLQSVLLDMDAPAVELNLLPANEAGVGRIGLLLQVSEPNLEQVIIAAARENGQAARRELLRLNPPLNDQPILLDMDRFPGGGDYRIDAVARDLAGNEKVASVKVSVPDRNARPLAIYGVQAQVKAEVKAPESIEQEEVEAAGNEAAEPPVDPTAPPPAGGAAETVPDMKPAWVTGELPPGAKPIGDWSWDKQVAYGVARSHVGGSGSGLSLHYFIHASKSLHLGTQDNLVQYVYLDPQHSPREILLQLYTTGGQGEHRVYWGDDLIDMGSKGGTAGLFHAGPLPKPGEWVRLRVPVEQLGLEDASITGALFGQFDGRAYWGATTTSPQFLDKQPAALTVAKSAKAVDNLPYTVEVHAVYHLSADAKARVSVQDAKGQSVASLIDGAQSAGLHHAFWDGKAADGKLLPDGAYTLVIDAEPTDHRAGEPAHATSAFELSTLIAHIALPGEGSMIRQTVPFYGTAAGRTFSEYVLEIGPGMDPQAWTSITTEYEPQVIGEPPLGLEHSRSMHGNLATAPIYSEPDGLYTARLRVLSKDGRTAEHRVHLWVGSVVSNGGAEVIEAADGGASLTVDAMSMRRGLHLFSLTPVDGAASGQALEELAASVGAAIIARPYEIRPAGYRFEQPARIEVAMTEAHPHAAVYALDAASGAWLRLPGQEVVPAAGKNSARLAARVDGLPAGHAIFAVLDDSKTIAPMLLEPAATNRVTSLFARAEPGAQVSLTNGSADHVLRTTITGDDGLAVFEGVYLNDGPNSFSVQARDAAGNEAASAHPVVVSYDPQPSSAVALQSLTIKQVGEQIVVDGEGSATPSKSHVAVRVHSESDPSGFSVELAPDAATVGHYAATLTMRHDSDAGLAQLGVRKPGEKIEAQTQQGTRASLTAADLTPPVAPVIKSSTNGTRVPARSAVSSAADFSSGTAIRNLLEEPIDLREDSVLSFRYRIDPDTTLHLAAHVNDSWFGFTLAGQPFDCWSAANGQRVASSVPFPLSADGQWHWAHLNLYIPVRGQQKDFKTFLLRQVAFGHWRSTGYKEVTAIPPSESGARYDVEQITFRKAAGGTHVALQWTDPPDFSGIGDYSYVLDENPDTEPSAEGKGKIDHSEFDIAAGQQTHYFHLRAKDNAGNWGATAHFALTSDGVGPVASDPSPAPNVQTGTLEIGITITDGPDGSGVNPDTIQLRVDGKGYDASSPAMSYDFGGGRLTFKPWMTQPPLPAWPDGKKIYVELAQAADFAGNPLQQIVKWRFTVGYGMLATGEARLLTQRGGVEPAWSPDGKRVAYIVEGEARQLWLIDVDSGNTSEVPVKLPDVATPSWSPDGATLVVSALQPGGRRGIALVDIKSGQARTLTTGADDDSDPIWLPDGGELLFVRNGDLWRMTPEGATPTLVFHDPDDAKVVRPQVSANGDAVLFWRSLYDDQVWLLDLKSGKSHGLATSGLEVDPAFGSHPDEYIYAARTGSSMLMAGPINSGASRQMLDNGGWFDRYARVSPNATRMVFQSTRNGFWNLWLLEWLKLGNLTVVPQQFSYVQNGTDGLQVAYNAAGFASAELSVTEPSGKTVRQFALGAGQLKQQETLKWDGLADDGRRLPDGDYVVQIRAKASGGGEPVQRGVTVTFAANTSAASTASVAAVPASGVPWYLYLLGAGLLAIGGALVIIVAIRRSRRERKPS